MLNFKVSGVLMCSSRFAFSFYLPVAWICAVEEMGRPKIDLSPYRDEIEQKLAESWTQDRILAWLKEEKDMKPSTKTLKRSLQEWAATSVRYQNQPEEVTEFTIALIDRLVHRHYYNDQQIVAALAQEGIRSSVWQVKKIRTDRKWTLRNRSEDAMEAAWQHTKRLCWDAIENGPAR